MFDNATRHLPDQLSSCKSSDVMASVGVPATRKSAERGVDGLSELLAFTESLVDDLPELGKAGIVPDGELDFDFLSGGGRSKPSRSPPLTAEEKRKERNKERERLKYRRKKERLGNLQQQVAALEHQLEELSSTTVAEERPSSADGLKTRLIELQRTKSRLRSENTQLLQQFRGASQRMALLSDLLKTDYRLYCAYGTYFRLFTPLSQQTCWDLTSKALKRMYAFESELPRALTVGSVVGWRGRRFVDSNLFKFALDKTFRHTKTQLVLERVWSSIIDPSRLEKCYSSDMNMRARLVQKVDDDNYVFLQEMRSTDPADNGALVKTAVLISRIKTETGCRIYIQNLDRRQIEMEETITGEPVKLHQELWITNEQLVWIDQEVVEDKVVSTKFRGIVPTLGTSAYFWMSEIVLVTIRIENQVFGPRFSVPVS